MSPSLFLTLMALVVLPVWSARDVAGTATLLFRSHFDDESDPYSADLEYHRQSNFKGTLEERVTADLFGTYPPSIENDALFFNSQPGHVHEDYPGFGGGYLSFKPFRLDHNVLFNSEQLPVESNGWLFSWRWMWTADPGLDEADFEGVEGDDFEIIEKYGSPWQAIYSFPTEDRIDNLIVAFRSRRNDINEIAIFAGTDDPFDNQYEDGYWELFGGSLGAPIALWNIGEITVGEWQHFSVQVPVPSPVEYPTFNLAATLMPDDDDDEDWTEDYFIETYSELLAETLNEWLHDDVHHGPLTGNMPYVSETWGAEIPMTWYNWTAEDFMIEITRWDEEEGHIEFTLCFLWDLEVELDWVITRDVFDLIQVYPWLLENDHETAEDWREARDDPDEDESEIDVDVFVGSDIYINSTFDEWDVVMFPNRIPTYKFALWINGERMGDPSFPDNDVDQLYQDFVELGAFTSFLAGKFGSGDVEPEDWVLGEDLHYASFEDQVSARYCYTGPEDDGEDIQYLFGFYFWEELEQGDDVPEYVIPQQLEFHYRYYNASFDQFNHVDNCQLSVAIRILPLEDAFEPLVLNTDLPEDEPEDNGNEFPFGDDETSRKRVSSQKRVVNEDFDEPFAGPYLWVGAHPGYWLGGPTGAIGVLQNVYLDDLTIYATTGEFGLSDTEETFVLWLANCGDGELDDWEECDADDPTCTNDCECQLRWIPDGNIGCTLCGNGRVDVGEMCDYAQDENCADDCSGCVDEDMIMTEGGVCTLCGNGILNEEVGEKCDFASDENCFEDCSGCTGFLQPRGDDEGTCFACGDGLLQPGEVCEVSLTPHICASDCSGCSNNYVPDEFGACVLCGNGILDEGEVCDIALPEWFTTLTVDSELAIDPTLVSACNRDCSGCADKKNEIPDGMGGCTRCGNRKLDAGEVCDASFPHCASDCSACEDNTLPSDDSLGSCTTCGNGVLEESEDGEDGEACDPSVDENCADDCSGCISPYYLAPGGVCLLCGNGFLDDGEVCDSVHEGCSACLQCDDGYEIDLDEESNPTGRCVPASCEDAETEDGSECTCQEKK